MPQLHPANGLEAGQVFSFWTVISFAEYRDRRAYYNCRCECGKARVVDASSLTSGKSKSCGRFCTIKGLHVTEHPLYYCWKAMVHRCYNPTSPGFSNYGGRSITVCKEWREDLYQFAADMGSRPPHHSIDRRDNNGNYCPGNCRWADRVTQQNNTRSNRLFTIDGETKTLAEWARLSRFSYYTISRRIDKSNWTIEKALSKPLIVGRPKT